MSRTDPAGARRVLANGAIPPAVTVLMPVYNGEVFLRQQMESILSQHYGPFEVVAVDDASTDRSWALLQEFVGNDHRVTVFRNSSNYGLVPTVRRLLGQVNTPLFAMADQDDIWDANKLQTSVRHLLERELALVYSDVRIVDEAGRLLEKSYLSGRGIRVVNGADPVPFVFRNPAIGHTILATRDVAEVALEREDVSLRYYEPWLLAAATSIGQVGGIYDQLGSYRSHSRNVVGPQVRSVSGRAGRMARNHAAIALRHQTRERALGVLAEFRPELMPAACAYQKRGLRALFSTPRVALLMVAISRAIGRRHALKELVLFVVNGALSPFSNERDATRDDRA